MNAVRGLAEALRHARGEALAPPPLLSLSQWAAEYARLPAGQNAMPGRFEAFGYEKEWLDCISDPRARQVTIQKSARVGASRCLDHAVAYFIHQDPAPIMFVLPRIEDAEDFSRSEILPMLLDTPCLFEIVGDIKSRDSNQRVSKRTFRNGSSITFVGANSPAGFRRISARIILFDEIDGYPLEAGTEGDQIALGVKRGETYWNKKVVLASTPLLKHQSRIERAYLESDMRRYFVPCPGCGHEQTLRFENLKWNKTDSGEHLPATAYYQCEKNGCVITEDRKPEMIERGRWVAERPFNGHAGFAVSALYSLFPGARWADVAREFLIAYKDPILRRTFTNIWLGESWEERGGMEWQKLGARARSSSYRRGVVPRGAYLLFCGLDVQIDRVEYQIVGRGSERKTYVVDYGTVGGYIGDVDTQRNLDTLLNRQWPNYVGRQMPIALAAIDAGFSAEVVLEYARRHSTNKLICVRGIAGDFAPRIARIARERNEKRGTLLKHPRGNYFNVGTHVLKTQLYLDLQREDADAPGYVAFPNDAEDRYFQELCSEQRIATKRMGQTVFRWEKVSDRQANEMLDTFIYTLAAMVKYGCAWISAERWRELEMQCSGGGVTPQGKVALDDRGRRIARIIKNLP
jgi:terminase, large subunit